MKAGLAREQENSENCGTNAERALPMPGTARSRRLRHGRFSEAGRIYLITITCHQRQPVFSDTARGRCVVRALRAVTAEANTLCYVIMPDHVHWLMQLTDHGELSEVVRKLKSLATRNLHEHGPAPNTIWQPGFHDRALRAQEDVMAVARYVIANPLRDGLTASLRRYSLWDAVWIK